VTRRGIVAGSLGAVLGGALGGGVGYALYWWLDPVLEAAGSPLEELQGIVASLVLVGLGAGLALGCALGLRLRHHESVLVTTLVLLAALPFAAPLVALASLVHWSAAPAAGVVIVTGVVAVIRLVVTRDAAPAASPASPSGDTARLAPPGHG
jgi:hypothetical protein